MTPAGGSNGRKRAKAAPRHAAPRRAESQRTGPRRAPNAEARSRRTPRGRLLGAFLMSVALVAFLLVAVFPTKTFLAQRAATHKAAADLQDLRHQNAALDARIDRLQTPAEIERIARKEYGLVKPGEEVYAILPTPPPPVELPDVWPFDGLARTLNR